MLPLRLQVSGQNDFALLDHIGGECAGIGLPVDGAPSSHILKPEIPAVEESVINEGFCMALAEAMRLEPARSSVRRVLGREFLLVERYDRLVDAQGHRQRLHQEDFCQALGVVPELKYQNEGGPGLAPLYDTLSTAVYPSLTPKMAMKIGGRYKFSEVQARHWERFFEEAGLAKAQARRRILALSRSLPTVARRLQSGPGRGFSGNAVVERINVLIERRCALTIRRLTEAAGSSA